LSEIIKSSKDKEKVIKELTDSKTILVNCQTWYRDSHGLFDYEEDSPEKLFLSEFKANGNFNLKRMPRDEVNSEQFSNFNLMRLEQSYLSELRLEKDKLIP